MTPAALAELRRLVVAAEADLEQALGILQHGPDDLRREIARALAAMIIVRGVLEFTCPTP
ncbi:MAG: hypothetical protein IT515_08060 [Burkholderiales bacterium]|nr:hypothetical protein [Burkholderiales bacterium]